MALKPPVEVPQGAIRLNTDSQKLEFYAQDQWWQMATDVPTLDGGARGCWAGGAKDPSAGNASTNAIDYVTIATAGNATDFGDLTESKNQIAGAGSKVRGYCLGGGNHPTNNRLNTIEYITFSSTGNGTDFGDLNTTNASEKSRMAAANSGTRAVTTGSISADYNTMWYITMTTSGIGEDFGDSTFKRENPAACSSPTRMISAGGSDGSSTNYNNIEYITIATLGNAQDFGDLSLARTTRAAASNSTRGLWCGGKTPSNGKVIDYSTIATLGNAVNFGELPTDTDHGHDACSSPIRVVVAGGGTGPNAGLNVINYLTIATQGNAVDFGDRTNDEKRPGAMSNANGGL